MPIRIFRSTDTSAPVLNSVAGKFIQLLDACLVDGYGSQAPLGQTKELSGTNLAVYKQPSGTSGMYLAVDDTQGQDAYIRGFSSITTPQAVGMNLNLMNIGTNPFPRYNQVATPIISKSYATTGNTTARPWVLVSNGKIIYLYIDTNSDGGSYGKVNCFGDISPYNPDDTNCCLIISSFYNYFCQFSNTNGVGLAEHYLSLGYNGFSTSSVCGKIPYLSYHPVSVFGQEGAYFPIVPDPLIGGFGITPVQITEPAPGATIVLRGRLPGIQVPCTGSGFQNGDTFTGTTGDLAGRTFEAVRCTSYYSSAQKGSFLFFETSDTWDSKNFR